MTDYCINSDISIRQFYSSQLNIEQFKSSGWNDGGLCPFHNDTKAGNFRVNVQHGGFKCFSYGAQGGDVVDFLRLLNCWTYNQAKTHLLGSKNSQPKNKSIQPPPEPDREAIRHKLKAEWEQAEPASPKHPYLVKKRIKSHGARQYRRILLIPAYNATNNLEAIQNINSNGDKWFSRGSQIQGNYFLVGKETSTTLIICEGFSTGSTLHEQSGYQVAVAFNAGNLESVAVAMRELYTEREIVIAADNDRHHKDGRPRADNPGLDAATKAAERINARLAIPEFEPGTIGSDFNDLANLEVSQ